MPILMRVSVHPLMADDTSMVLSRSTALDTMSTTLDIFTAFATEVPPNFITCIYRSMFFWFFRHLFPQRMQIYTFSSKQKDCKYHLLLQYMQPFGKNQKNILFVLLNSGKTEYFSFILGFCLEINCLSMKLSFVLDGWRCLMCSCTDIPCSRING